MLSIGHLLTIADVKQITKQLPTATAWSPAKSPWKSTLTGSDRHLTSTCGEASKGSSRVILLFETAFLHQPNKRLWYECVRA